MASMMGCQHRPTSLERRASGQAWFSREVEQQALLDYVRQRTAVLITPWGGIGCASAIDARGYFLTSAHGLADGSEVLLVRFPGGPEVEPERAQVVWLGGVERGGPDLALLRVKRSLSAVFAWSPAPAVGATVFVMGSQPHADPGPPATLLPLSGRLSRVSVEIFQEGGWRIEHDAPLRPGDSGGPVVDSAGRLAAVSYATARRVILPGVGWRIGAWAHRPRPDMIDRLIAETERRRRTNDSLGADVRGGRGGR
jgi:S1-C subfamily serine protease